MSIFTEANEAIDLAIKEIERLRASNAELLAALKETVQHLPGARSIQPETTPYGRAMAAIAKAEAQP